VGGGEAMCLSENAKILLMYLNSYREEVFKCIAEQRSSNVFYVIPGPNFNWDGRIDIQSYRIRHPECVYELFDHGFLIVGMHEVSNWKTDYSCVWESYENRVYTLTEEGKREGLKLLSEKSN